MFPIAFAQAWNDVDDDDCEDDDMKEQQCKYAQSSR